MIADLALLGLAGVAAATVVARSMFDAREAVAQTGIDRAFAICAARSGQSDQRIAIELGRPAHLITAWREAEGVAPGANTLDLEQETRIRELIQGHRNARELADVVAEKLRRPMPEGCRDDR